MKLMLFSFRKHEHEMERKYDEKNERVSRR